MTDLIELIDGDLPFDLNHAPSREAVSGTSARDENRAGAVVHDVIGNAAEEEPSGPIESPCADHDQVGPFSLRSRDDALAGFAGPHQEAGINAHRARFSDNVEEASFAIGANLVQARRARDRPELLAEALASVDHVHDEKPGAECSAQVYRLDYGGIGYR